MQLFPLKLIDVSQLNIKLPLDERNEIFSVEKKWVFEEEVEKKHHKMFLLCIIALSLPVRYKCFIFISWDEQQS